MKLDVEIGAAVGKQAADYAEDDVNSKRLREAAEDIQKATKEKLSLKDCCDLVISCPRISMWSGHLYLERQAHAPTLDSATVLPTDGMCCSPRHQNHGRNLQGREK